VEHLSIEQKQLHDIVGYYNRFDILRLTVDQRPNQPIALIRDETDVTQAAQSGKHEEAHSAASA
jgi:hypothetical protein